MGHGRGRMFSRNGGDSKLNSKVAQEITGFDWWTREGEKGGAVHTACALLGGGDGAYAGERAAVPLVVAVTM
jgi:hypothetical protein